MSRVRPTIEPDHVAGSPGGGEPVFLAAGKLHRPHGVHGEILMEIYTDFPERLTPGSLLFVGPGHQPVSLKSRRWHQQNLLVSFEGYETLESVGELRNQLVYVSAADRPALPEGEYYHHQLIGLQVVDEADKPLGRLTEILGTGANDVLVVRPEIGSQILLPMIDDVVLKIDLQGGKMWVHLLPGMVDKAEV